eukprot:1923172-Alexandrium_andersonii.AAC.1
MEQLLLTAPGPAVPRRAGCASVGAPALQAAGGGLAHMDPPRGGVQCCGALGRLGACASIAGQTLRSPGL